MVQLLQQLRLECSHIHRFELFIFVAVCCMVRSLARVVLVPAANPGSTGKWMPLLRYSTCLFRPHHFRQTSSGRGELIFNALVWV
jgi:hypothetical protein